MSTSDPAASPRGRAEAALRRAVPDRLWALYFAHRPAVVLAMALYLALLHLAAAGLLWASPLPGQLAWRLGLGSRWVEKDEAFHNRAGQLRRHAEAVDPGAVVFIGDSLLAALDVGALADRAVQLSIPGETARRVAARLPGLLPALRGARLVLLHVGTNDLRYREPGALARPLGRIMGKIPAGVPVLVDAVLPVDEAAFGLYGNAEVRAANAVLRRACAARPGCRFVDTSGGLAGAGGGLDPRFHDGGGLHLSPAGHRAWRAALAAVLDPVRSF